MDKEISWYLSKHNRKWLKRIYKKRKASFKKYLQDKMNHLKGR